MTGKERFGDAVESFDRANAADPNTESDGERDRPQALLYAERMTRWLERLTPDASEPLRLAARSQHLQRWRVPRANFPMDRAEYHKWRTTRMRFHAERAGEILEAVGHDRETVTRVQALLRKEGLLGARPSDPDAQTLEGVACVVFLESYFADFSTKHDEEKLIRIIRKTWNKMSPRDREAALALERDCGGQCSGPYPPSAMPRIMAPM